MHEMGGGHNSFKHRAGSIQNILPNIQDFWQLCPSLCYITQSNHPEVAPNMVARMDRIIQHNPECVLGSMIFSTYG